jgi:lipid-binding SYLF domain-containing protein
MKNLVLCACAWVALVWSAGAMPAEGSHGMSQEKQQKIAEDAQRILSRLYATTPGSRELVNRSRGLLVFPTVVSAGEETGGQYGEGELLVGGKQTGLYSATGSNLEPQHGAKSKAIVVLFLTPEALAAFQSSHEWTAGPGAAALRLAADGSIDTQTMPTPVVGFAVIDAGIAIDRSIESAKVRPLSE